MFDEEQALRVAVHVLHAANDRRSTAGEIAEMALQPHWRAEWQKLQCNIPDGVDAVDLARQLGRKLASYVAKTRKDRRAIVGSKRGWELGPKANHYLTAHPDYAPSESTQFIGLAGEHAVISELLAIDWNATKLPVDTGVDVVAVRAHEIRTVQVKSAHALTHKPETYQFQIDKASHERFANIRHYYVLVMRRRTASRYLNDYLIFSTGELETYMRRGAFYGGEVDRWTVRVEIRAGRYLLRGDDALDVSSLVNNFKQQFIY